MDPRFDASGDSPVDSEALASEMSTAVADSERCLRAINQAADVIAVESDFVAVIVQLDRIRHAAETLIGAAAGRTVPRLRLRSSS